jgi:hypothetical protein
VVPSTWLSIIFFLLFVAPGILFDLLSERRRPGATESAFREISRVVLGSVAFSTVGLVVAGVVRAVFPGRMPDLARLFANADAYMSTHYRVVMFALALETGVACSAAAGAHWLLMKHAKRPPLRAVSAWQMVLREECPSGRTPYLRVRTTRGDVYMGYVGYSSADLSSAEREIVLVPPLWSKLADGRELRPVPVEWQRIVLPARDVAALAVSYRLPLTKVADIPTPESDPGDAREELTQTTAS